MTCIRYRFAAVFGLFLVGCVHRSTLSMPPRPAPAGTTAAEEHRSVAKFHLRDGSLMVLDDWEVVGSEVHGSGRWYGVERNLLRDGNLRVPLDAIVIVEMPERRPNPALIGAAIITGVSIGFTIYCLANTKACWGSCPTFYVPDGRGGWALEAEGFSTSIARILEADDVDDLPEARPERGAITMAVRNEALETHMIRRLSLLAVRGPKESTVVRGVAADDFLAVGASEAPATCEGPAIDRAACDAIAQKDAREVALDSDGKDLAARTTVTLHYPPPGRRDVALVLTARNSLMSTYVLYQLFAYLGREAGTFMAAVERGEPEALGTFARFDRALGGVEVAWRQKGKAFQPAGTLGYIGPIARATRAVAFEVADPAEPVDVTLTFARAHWKLDAARLAPVVERGLVPIEVAPEITAAEGRDPAVVAASLRGQGSRVVTLPGDELVLRFAVPEEPKDRSTGYFLRSRGYYYEWIRDEWVREEDPARARAYLGDPARALRELAPAYHAVEPTMESVFRASRYARPR